MHVSKIKAVIGSSLKLAVMLLKFLVVQNRSLTLLFYIDKNLQQDILIWVEQSKCMEIFYIKHVYIQSFCLVDFIYLFFALILKNISF